MQSGTTILGITYALTAVDAFHHTGVSLSSDVGESSEDRGFEPVSRTGLSYQGLGFNDCELFLRDCTGNRLRQK